MRLAVRILLMILLIGVGTYALGSEQLRPGVNGILIRRPPTQAKCAEVCLVAYDRLGIQFAVKKGDAGIDSLLILKPKSSVQKDLHPDCSRCVVPGFGAYGVTLDMPREEVRRRAFSGRSQSEFSKGLSVSRDINLSTHQVIWFPNGTVDSIEIIGGFRTSEGVTEKSRLSDIRRVYGTPDALMEWSPRKPINWGFLPFVTMPVFGLLTGLLIRRVSAAGGFVRFGGSIGVGFVAAGLSASGSHIMYTWLSHLSAVWEYMPCLALTAALCGAAGVLLHLALSHRLSGRISSWTVPILMLLTAPAVSGIIGFPFIQDTRIILISPYAYLNAVFMLGMLLGVKTRHPRPTQR